MAAPALVPTLVAPDTLPKANARIELARTVAFAAGPALGGALVGWIGGAPAFAFAGALSISALILLAGLQESPRPTPPRRHPLHEIREGAGFVFSHPLLAPLFVTQFVFTMAFFILLAVYVPYAIANLGLTASGVGATLATYGVGMMIGALFAARIMDALPFGIIIAIGPVSGLLGAVLMALTILIPSSALAALGLFLLGVGPILWVISTTTLRQIVTPQRLLGRVSAINIVTYGARPVGSAIGAFVGSYYGAETALVVAAAGFLIQVVIILTSPAVRLASQPEMAG